MTRNETSMKWVVLGLLIGIFVASMDNTIVATAMATIVADLGGLDKFVWVTSAYMVTEMAEMPIFGKLSDMYGRKRFFIFGLAVFLVGSMLCGIAQNIVQLSYFYCFFMWRQKRRSRLSRIICSASVYMPRATSSDFSRERLLSLPPFTFRFLFKG
ncbi:hypothetical protein B4119_1351 [Parageobacillus caldoxylosilyticus]|uniref:Major facilitator superfamily (MFS) profile domain-containing protein n=1 Tax=Saccharococcus caldoxylosilyticus TaxID=81408 RepID=A0A150L576_9BACL|nr:hypothetical protein B4119_1351 [Parageobacillus caldoxylosilyticus]